MGAQVSPGTPQRHPRALTFLKTAGSGSGGPKKGTSSRAVTETCGGCGGEGTPRGPSWGRGYWGTGGYLVEGALSAPLLQLHHHEGVEEVGGDHVGDKRCVLVLEDDGHDVVADVTLPLQLWGQVGCRGTRGDIGGRGGHSRTPGTEGAHTRSIKRNERPCAPQMHPSTRGCALPALCIPKMFPLTHEGLAISWAPQMPTITHG